MKGDPNVTVFVQGPPYGNSDLTLVSQYNIDYFDGKKYADDELRIVC